jgi:gamma-glutamyl:cysteine ligase YbdK (ATP-grasp superfamily)
MTEHLINPPPELVQEWATVNGTHYEDLATLCRQVAIQAAQWGAEQELEACCEWMQDQELRNLAKQVRAARRPKPPSLKEQAQAELKRLIALIPTEGAIAMAEPIRRALEALPND